MFVLECRKMANMRWPLHYHRVTYNIYLPLFPGVNGAALEAPKGLTLATYSYYWQEPMGPATHTKLECTVFLH